ncbi:homoserine O-acetyltransferase [Halobacillus litoralis]|uniref:Homoserine O-acetyltransferase n=1 Tax=Halobacillus litoralis TaxID=45668 RepID=A0A845DSI8_9BACI|nr:MULTISPECIES: homoserine O-acetyltransferase [Halobacillus]MYL20366.1 homoserine O-acetyltransferase [Halobacillus litoralis]MYL29460.1 homoserine O-acetyltransferase [Halobacillus halophilus]MYL36677.1 homoserine O-acetyltransferase [Halobacillus litoralis]
MSLKNPASQTDALETIELGPFHFESGGRLESVELAYERSGPVHAPVIVVCHALTGNQEAVGTEEQPGWWAGLIGEGCPIDTSLFQVITFNVLGGCHGSTGPASLNPDTGEPFRQKFPKVTIRDMVRAQYEALKKMGIHQVKAVAGGSLGGMQTYEWGLLYPDFMEKLLIMAATPYLSDYGIAFNHIGAKAIKNDPLFQDGEYATNESLQGFEIARMTGMVTYRSPTLFEKRFDRSNGGDTYEIQSYLDYQGDKIKERFDANSYLYLLDAMNNHDIGRNRGGWKAAAAQYKADMVTFSFEHDLLYPEELISAFASAAPKAVHRHIPTDYGHDGFLVEFDRWGPFIKEELNGDETQ